MPRDRRSRGKGSEPPAGNGSGRSESRKRLSSPAVGWETYRGWLGRLERDVSRRQGPESIYTWSGYQAWTARVRADWEQDN